MRAGSARAWTRVVCRAVVTARRVQGRAQATLGESGDRVAPCFADRGSRPCFAGAQLTTTIVRGHHRPLHLRRPPERQPRPRPWRHHPRPLPRPNSPMLAPIASDDTVAFEQEVLLHAFILDMGSARQVSAVARLRELSNACDPTFKSKWGQGIEAWNVGAVSSGLFGGERGKWPNPTWEHLEEWLDATLVANQRYLEAGELAASKTEKNFAYVLRSSLFGLILVMSHSSKWDPEQCGGEQPLVESTDEYEYHVDGSLQKNAGMRIDFFRGGSHLPILVLHFGNLDSFRVWHSVKVSCARPPSAPVSIIPMSMLEGNSCALTSIWASGPKFRGVSEPPWPRRRVLRPRRGILL